MLETFMSLDQLTKDAIILGALLVIAVLFDMANKSK